MLLCLSVSLLRCCNCATLISVELAPAQAPREVFATPSVTRRSTHHHLSCRLGLDARTMGEAFRTTPLFRRLHIANATLVAMLVGVVVHVAHGLNDDRKVVIVVASSVLGLASTSSVGGVAMRA